MMHQEEKIAYFLPENNGIKVLAVIKTQTKEPVRFSHGFASFFFYKGSCSHVHIYTSLVAVHIRDTVLPVHRRFKV